MIVLDTNVLSELMHADPAASVLNWLVRAGSDDLRITSITRAEIFSGISILPHGRRGQDLQAAANRAFARAFDGPILAFDAEAADHYADIVSARRRLGRSTNIFDLMIVAIARVHGAAVATRNVSDFEGCGVSIQNAWNAG